MKTKKRGRAPKKDAKTQPKILLQKKKLRAELIAKGICTICRKRKVDKPRSKTLCKVCRPKMAKYMKERQDRLRREAKVPVRKTVKKVRKKAEAKKAKPEVAKSVAAN